MPRAPAPLARGEALGPLPRHGPEPGREAPRDARARALGVEAADGGGFAPANVVERIVMLGLPASPKAVAVAGRAVDFSWTAGALTIRRPDLPMAGAWAVDFTF